MKDLVAIGEVLKLSVNLKDRNFSAWAPQKPVKVRVEEAFAAIGASWADMEMFLAMCYRIGINPLPQLRKLAVGEKIMDDVCQVVYQKAGDKSPYLHRDAIVCVWDRDLDVVTLEAVDYEKYEDGKEHLLKLDRVTNVIRNRAREVQLQKDSTMTEYQGRAPRKGRELVF